MTMDVTPKRVIIITRVSTEKQKENTSPSGQEKLCRRKCAEYGWPVVAVYNEQASGKLSTRSRVVTDQALRDLEADKADVVMLYDMFRYGRDVEFQHNMLKRITKVRKQLQFATVTLEYDPRTGKLTPESETTFNTLGGQSSTDHAHIARRLYNGMVEAASSGIQVSRAQHPFAMHIVRKNDVIRGEYPEGSQGKYFEIPERRAHLEALFEKFDAGAGLQAMADWFEEEGVPSHHGGPWSPSSIRAILKNEVYIGHAYFGRTRRMMDENRLDFGMDKYYQVAVPREQWIHIPTPVMIDPDLWKRCQQRLENNKVEISGRRDRRYLLTGLLKCPECGRALLGETRKYSRAGSMHATRVYNCRSARKWRTGNGHSQMKALIAAPLEERIIALVLRAIGEPDTLQKALARFNVARAQTRPGDDAKKLEKQLAAIEKNQKSAARAKVEAMGLGQSTKTWDELLAEYSDKANAIAAQLEALQSKPVSNAPLPLQGGIDDLRELLTSPPSRIPYADKNDSLRQIVKWIIPEAAGATIKLALRSKGEPIVLKLDASDTIEIIAA